MDVGMSLETYIMRSIFLIILSSVFVFTPFVVRRVLPNSYKGVWKLLGDLIGSPLRATSTPLGYFVSATILAGAIYGQDFTQVQWLIFLAVCITLASLIVLLLRWSQESRT